MSISNETRSLLFWAADTNWRSLDTNLAKAVDRWKKAGCPDLPKGLFCPHCDRPVKEAGTKS